MFAASANFTGTRNHGRDRGVWLNMEVRFVPCIAAAVSDCILLCWPCDGRASGLGFEAVAKRGRNAPDTHTAAAAACAPIPQSQPCNGPAGGMSSDVMLAMAAAQKGRNAPCMYDLVECGLWWFQLL